MDKSILLQVNTLLRQKDYESILDLCQVERQAWKALQRNLYSTDDDLIWSAVEASAMMMKRWWDEGEEEEVREYIRGLFWSLNDESGGIGWNAPQTIAEIIIRIPELIKPYGSMMINRTMEESLLVPSSLWAIGRMGRLIEPAVEFFQDAVLANFQTTDSQILGLAAWAMGEVAYMPALPMLETLCGRKDLVRIFVNGEFRERTLGDWAEDAVTTIDQNS